MYGLNFIVKSRTPTIIIHRNLQVFVTGPHVCSGRRRCRHWSDFPSAISVDVHHAPISLREFPLTLIPPLQCSALFGDIRKMAAAPLYCVCRQPYDFNRFMIECDICNDWFHGRYGNYGLLNRCGSVGMYRPPCHGGILVVNLGVSCESAGDARWGYLNMTVRDHARLECDLSVIDRFLSNVFVINVYRELLRQPVSTILPSGLIFSAFL